jgi:hypothetical protein
MRLEWICWAASSDLRPTDPPVPVMTFGRATPQVLAALWDNAIRLEERSLEIVEFDRPPRPPWGLRGRRSAVERKSKLRYAPRSAGHTDGVSRVRRPARKWRGLRCPFDRPNCLGCRVEPSRWYRT